MKKALHGRWQLHVPGGKSDEDNIVLIQSVDGCLERRQEARLILVYDLFHRGVGSSPDWVFATQEQRGHRPRSRESC